MLTYIYSRLENEPDTKFILLGEWTLRQSAFIHARSHYNCLLLAQVLGCDKNAGMHIDVHFDVTSILHPFYSFVPGLCFAAELIH